MLFEVGAALLDKMHVEALAFIPTQRHEGAAVLRSDFISFIDFDELIREQLQVGAVDRVCFLVELHPCFRRHCVEVRRRPASERFAQARNFGVAARARERRSTFAS